MFILYLTLSLALAIDENQPIGGYGLVRKIAHGKFGAVFLAIDLKTGEEVALKIIPLSVGRTFAKLLMVQGKGEMNGVMELMSVQKLKHPTHCGKEGQILVQTETELQVIEGVKDVVPGDDERRKKTLEGPLLRGKEFTGRVIAPTNRLSINNKTGKIHLGKICREFLQDVKGATEGISDLCISVSPLMHGDLRSLIEKGLSEAVILSILYQMACALRLLVSKGLIHSDVKFDNWMYLRKDGDIIVKLGDLDACTPMGEFGQYSPHTLSPWANKTKTTMPGDSVWALCILSIQVLAGLERKAFKVNQKWFKDVGGDCPMDSIRDRLLELCGKNQKLKRFVDLLQTEREKLSIDAYLALLSELPANSPTNKTC